MPSPLHPHRELIHTLSVVQKQPLAQVVAALQDRGFKTSAPTLSRYLRSTEFTDYASESRAIDPQPTPPLSVLPAPGQPIAPPPPPAPRQAPGDTEILLDQNLDLLAELAGKIEGHSLTVTELERFMRGELADFLRQQKAELPAPPFDPATVRSIWARAFVVSGLVWFAIIAAAGLAARSALAP
jgi:hypothetical protein